MSDPEKTDIPSAATAADPATAPDASAAPPPPPNSPAGAESAGAAIPPPAGAATAELEKLRKERDENYNRYLRAVADLDTYRRRVAREKDELRQFANRDLLESLLPVYEHLGLAIASSSQQNADAESIAKGVALVLEQFRTALAAKGLVEINPAAGSDFDPHQHESIGHAPHPTIPEEKIVQLVRAGFSLNGRVLRPASVLLSSGPAKPEGSANG